MNRPLYEELRRRVGMGGNARVRDLHFRRLACLAERLHKIDPHKEAAAMAIINQCVEESRTKDDPGRWFTVAVIGRLQDHELLRDSQRNARVVKDQVADSFRPPE